MESERDEASNRHSKRSKCTKRAQLPSNSASNQHPKGRKRTKRAQYPSNSVQYSNLKIPALPPELITEILSRLPVKSLLQFRSVSKSWVAIISSPEFIKIHLSLSANKNKEDTHHILKLGLSGSGWKFKDCPLSSLFCDSVVNEAFDLVYPIKNASKDISIVGSCNGLILLAHYSEYSLLWNPTIRKCKKLPEFKPRLKKNNYAVYGFGYDEFHDDYKVVGIFNNYGGSDYVEFKMYSLKSDSWTSVDYCGEILNASGSSQKMKLDGWGLFVNGKLHWDTITSGPVVRTGKNIISFDLANEKWDKLEKPLVGKNELCVGMLGSDLSVFCDYEESYLGAWVMKEYGVKESWVKMFTIEYPKGQSLYPPFFMSSKGEILVVFGSTFMIYNSKDHSVRYTNVTNSGDCSLTEIYIESLVCPFSTEGTENATKERKKLRSKQSSNK
ncbi:F-box/kelch-repeat protein At3g23880-like [Nicotiana tabacum]|uniref:F-box/kelch-repeat protein At3g23880-like n=1 Tax=Nicotiana tabacum TaxID=4097 RepID=A0A1S4CEK1_TOBAC|nr:PREDICTED: F-box/kelch-repeat protein At3g23880-like [Nicotiana tabacum]